MRRITIEDSECFVENIMGFAVLAVMAGPENKPVGWRGGMRLAFCSPKDRLAKNWARAIGYQVAQARVITPGKTLREGLVTACINNENYVPHAIAAAVRRAIETIPQGEAK